MQGAGGQARMTDSHPYRSGSQLWPSQGNVAQYLDVNIYHISPGLPYLEVPYPQPSGSNESADKPDVGLPASRSTRRTSV